MRYRAMWLMGSFLLLACSGSNQPRTGPEAPVDNTPPAPRGVTSEQMEEIQSVERAGRPAVIDCYTDELERRNDKKLKGSVTVEIHIAATGAVQQVRISRSTLQAPQVLQCIDRVIRSWEFPRLRADTWYGTTFQFSPAY